MVSSFVPSIGVKRPMKIIKKSLFVHWFSKHVRLAPIGLFAFVLIPTSDFAAQGPSESDLGVSMKCVISMSDDIFFLKTSVFAAQEQSESVVFAFQQGMRCFVR